MQVVQNIYEPKGVFLFGAAGFLDDFLRLPMLSVEVQKSKRQRTINHNSADAKFAHEHGRPIAGSRLEARPPSVCLH